MPKKKLSDDDALALVLRDLKVNYPFQTSAANMEYPPLLTTN
ncbi:MAG: hypothetical protein ACOXZ5_09050 [Syntrophomonadaceae bacterium]|jgi:hypothetical protein